jgi:hypothetical protein
MTNLVLLILIAAQFLAAPQVTNPMPQAAPQAANPLPQCDPCPFVR